jgi:hypothetical protein
MPRPLPLTQADLDERQGLIPGIVRPAVPRELLDELSDDEIDEVKTETAKIVANERKKPSAARQWDFSDAVGILGIKAVEDRTRCCEQLVLICRFYKLTRQPHRRKRPDAWPQPINKHPAGTRIAKIRCRCTREQADSKRTGDKPPLSGCAIKPSNYGTTYLKYPKHSNRRRGGCRSKAVSR